MDVFFEGVLVGFANVGQLYGLEKFWAFRKFSKKETDPSGHDLPSRDDPREKIDPRILEWLAKYQKLEDFRVEVSTSTLHSNSESPFLCFCLFYLSIPLISIYSV